MPRAPSIGLRRAGPILPESNRRGHRWGPTRSPDGHPAGLRRSVSEPAVHRHGASARRDDRVRREALRPRGPWLPAGFLPCAMPFPRDAIAIARWAATNRPAPALSAAPEPPILSISQETTTYSSASLASFRRHVSFFGTDPNNRSRRQDTPTRPVLNSSV